MSVAAVQCDNCGTLVHDAAAERCPRCRSPLAPPTLRLPAHLVPGAVVPAPAPALVSDSWAEIDGAWRDLDTDVVKAPAIMQGPPAEEHHAGPARTLVGMGAIELFDDDDDAVGSVGATQPLAVVADEVTLPRQRVPEPEPLSPQRAAPSPLGPPSGPSHLPGDIRPRAGPGGGLPTMPHERVAPTGRFAREVGADSGDDLVVTSEVELNTGRRQRSEGGLPTLPPDGLPAFGKGLPTLEMAGAPEPGPTFSVATFDDASVAPTADERPSEAKTLPPLSGAFTLVPLSPPAVVAVEGAPTQRRQALSPAALPPPDDSAFADTTMDARPGRPMVAVRANMSAGLIVLWVVAVAATVAAVLLVLLK